MGILANSYGSLEAVENLTRRYTNDGDYSGLTNPSDTAVESWIDQVSGTLNACLAGAGFVIPVTQADAKLALDALVNEAVADLCHAANSAGRFFTDRALEAGLSPMRAIRKEMATWVEEQAAGLANLGVTRRGDNSGAVVLFRETDEGGRDVPPIFSRLGFGESYRDWDS